MRLLVVMDRPETINPLTDTTLVIIAEAHRRGHRVSVMTPQELSLSGPAVFTVSRQISSVKLESPCFSFTSAESGPLSDFDLVFMRKDPPFNMDYYFATQLLERGRGQTVVLNDPRALREANEKLFIFNFPELIAPTSVTRSLNELKEFLAEHEGEMVVKPLDRCGGSGIFHVRQDDRNTNSILEMLSDGGNSLVMAQKYIPGARKGDKRILLLEGQPIGAVMRVPRADEVRGNLHAGGRAEKTTLTERDQEICAKVGARLKQDGLFFVGLDVIDGWLTEVNVTSPTGIQEINRLEGVQLERQVVDAFERVVG